MAILLISPLFPRYFTFEIALKDAIDVMETRHFTVSLHFLGTLQPKPAAIPQKEPQILFLRESHFFCSPYYVDEQRTRIKVGTTKVLSFTDLSPSKLKDRVLSLGPYHGKKTYKHTLTLLTPFVWCTILWLNGHSFCLFDCRGGWLCGFLP
jgi:hypothetical protein